MKQRALEITYYSSHILILFISYYLQVTKFSDTLNLAILYLTELVHIKFSNFIQLSIHFTGFSESNENVKIAKFNMLLNLVTYTLR